MGPNWTRISSQLPDHIVRAWNKIHQIQPASFFLLGAVGVDGAHLYALAERERPRSLNMPGFGAIGTGAGHAMHLLLRNADVKNRPLADVIYRVYEAKKAAENHRDVGKGTDVAVILPGREVHFFDDEAISRLEAVYEDKKPPSLMKSEIESIQALLPVAKP